MVEWIAVYYLRYLPGRVWFYDRRGGCIVPQYFRFPLLDSNLALQVNHQRTGIPTLAASTSLRSAAVKSHPQPMPKYLPASTTRSLQRAALRRYNDLRFAVNPSCERAQASSAIHDDRLHESILPAHPAPLPFVPFRTVSVAQDAPRGCRQPRPHNCRWPAAHSCCLLYSSIIVTSPRLPCSRSRLEILVVPPYRLP